MADNVTVNGEDYAFDEIDIGGFTVKVGRNKIGFGADGVYNEVEDAAPLPTKAYPSADQDPILNETSGKRTAVTTGASALVLTPPAGCKYAQLAATTDMLIRTDGDAAADGNGASLLPANTPLPFPVVAGVNVNAIAISVDGVVYAVPMKVR